MSKDVPDFYKDLPYERVATPSKGGAVADVYRAYRIVSVIFAMTLLVSIGIFIKERIDAVTSPVEPLRTTKVWTRSFEKVCRNEGGTTEAVRTSDSAVVATFVRTDEQWEYASMIARSEDIIAPIFDGSTVNVVACVDRVHDVRTEAITCQDVGGRAYLQRGGEFVVTFRNAQTGYVMREPHSITASLAECDAEYQGESQGGDIFVRPQDQQLVELYRDVFVR